jgi:hypothetical protein
MRAKEPSIARNLGAHCVRPAIRGLSARCRGGRQFRQRTDDLVAEFRKNLPDVLTKAEKLSPKLAAMTAEPRRRAPSCPCRRLVYAPGLPSVITTRRLRGSLTP